MLSKICYFEEMQPKYKKKFCPLLIAHCKQGGDFQSWCGIMGITMPTFLAWAENKEFREAVDIAEMAMYAFWEKLNREKCMIEGLPTLINSNMANRFGWGARPQGEAKALPERPAADKKLPPGEEKLKKIVLDIS